MTEMTTVHSTGHVPRTDSHRTPEDRWQTQLLIASFCRLSHRWGPPSACGCFFTRQVLLPSVNVLEMAETHGKLSGDFVCFLRMLANSASSSTNSRLSQPSSQDSAYPSPSSTHLPNLGDPIGARSSCRGWVETKPVDAGVTMGERAGCFGCVGSLPVVYRHPSAEACVLTCLLKQPHAAPEPRRQPTVCGRACRSARPCHNIRSHGNGHWIFILATYPKGK
jgi:hypothetical protein